MTFRSKEYVAWKSAAVWHISAQSKRQRVAGPFSFTLYVRRPDKRKRDLDNLIKVCLDALEAAGVIDGDHLCERLDAEWVYEGPETTLIIEEVSVDG